MPDWALGASDQEPARMKARSVPFRLVPPVPGTYVLVMTLAFPTEVGVGKLGTFFLPAGWYAYVGSALGPGGLAGRLGRHQRPYKRLHWHIDYLLSVSHLIEIWWAVSAERRECAWVEVLSQVAGMSMPVRGFGSSDCGCPSHLLYTECRLLFSDLAARLAGQCALCLTVPENPI